MSRWRHNLGYSMEVFPKCPLILPGTNISFFCSSHVSMERYSRAKENLLLYLWVYLWLFKVARECALSQWFWESCAELYQRRLWPTECQMAEADILRVLPFLSCNLWKCAEVLIRCSHLRFCQNEQINVFNHLRDPNQLILGQSLPSEVHQQNYYLK